MEVKAPPPTLGFREAHLRDYWRIVWQGRWTILAIFLVVCAAVTGWTLMQPPVYRASAIIEIQPKARGLLSSQDASGLGAAGYGWLAEEKYHNTQVEILRSRDVAQRVVRTLGLASHPRFAEARDIVDAFRGMIRVEPRRETGLIAVSIQGSDPNEITQWVNAVARAYVDRNFEKAGENVHKAVDTIRKQITSLQQDLAAAEDQRIDTLEETQIFDSESQAGIVRAKLTRYHAALSDIQLELNELEERLRNVRQTQVANVDMASVREVMDDDTLRDLLGTRVELERQLEKVRVSLRPDHPEFVGVTNELQTVRARMQDRVNVVMENLENRRRQLLDQAAYLTREIRQAQDLSLQVVKATSKYDIVKTDAETKKRVFDMINKTMSEVQISAELMTNNVAVLDEATPPLAPIAPRKRLNVAIGAMLGVFLGLGAVFFLEYLDNTIRTPEDVEKYLGLSVLGVVPKMGDEGLAGNRGAREAYQSLRTSIIFSSKNRQRKVLLITSTGPQEGKSSSVANLGRTLAAAGDRVIIIDCDMRRPTQHLHHGIDRDHGLANYLAAPVHERDWTIYPKPVQPANLEILTCGAIPPNPPELIGTERFAELLASARSRYDWVLVDSPPASSLADATLLASMCDMVVLVVQHNRTDRDLVVKTLQQLRSVNPTMAGVVLNNVDFDRSVHKDYYYAGYYYTEDEPKGTRKRRVERKAQVG